MKPRCFIVGVVAIVFTALAFADAADDQKERDRLGLTQEEWETCKVLKLKPSKVRELLSSGITLDEYAGSTWLVCGISEEQWIAYRRQGMKDIDIRQMNKVEAEPAGGGAGKLIVASFFLPGYGHHKMDKNLHALAFAGVSVTSATLFIVHRKTVSFGTGTERQFRFGYFALWLANSVACAADVWRRNKFADNPDLERFSLVTEVDKAEIKANFRF